MDNEEYHAHVRNAYILSHVDYSEVILLGDLHCEFRVTTYRLNVYRTPRIRCVGDMLHNLDLSSILSDSYVRFIAPLL